MLPLGATIALAALGAKAHAHDFAGEPRWVRLTPRPAIPTAREPLRDMERRPRTCGAQADVRLVTRRDADGRDEMVYRVICPVCGRRGPAVAAAGKGQAVAEAVAAWNALLARGRPPTGRFEKRLGE